MRDTYNKKWQSIRQETGYDPDWQEDNNTYFANENVNEVIDFNRLMDIEIFNWVKK